MHKLVLLRHGESQWNQENRFTGWHDVNLTEQGEREGKEAGCLLKEQGFDWSPGVFFLGRGEKILVEAFVLH